MRYTLTDYPTETVTKKQAIESLVDTCLNVEEYEWAGCSVTMVIRGHKTKADAIKDIMEVANKCFTKVDDDLIEKAYKKLYENQAMFEDSVARFRAKHRNG
jgi:hypothetical protein